jgi:hypothetical protein
MIFSLPDLIRVEPMANHAGNLSTSFHATHDANIPNTVTLGYCFCFSGDIWSYRFHQTCLIGAGVIPSDMLLTQISQMHGHGHISL